MQNGLKFRLGVVIASVLLSIWLLLPNALNPADRAKMEAYHARLADPELPLPAELDPWYIPALPNLFLNLGLDLVGGLDLTLDVVSEDAVLSTVQRDILPLEEAAKQEGLKIADIRRDRNRPALKISPGEGVELEQIQTLMNKRMSYYQYKTSVEENGKKYFLYEMRPEEQKQIAARSVDQALDTIRNRIDATGVKEPSISRKGDQGINVQLPGETDVERAIAAIGTTARLEFILVDEEADTNKVDAGLKAAKAALAPEAYNDDRALSEWLADNGHIGAKRHLYWEYTEERGKKPERRYPLLLKEPVILTGDDINDAQTSMDQQSASAYVALEFKPRGAATFARVTTDNVKKRFAIVLDGKIKSAPQINEPIPGGRASISMGDGSVDQQFKEASNLALVLRSGALPAPVVVGEVRTVGATLGAQAIQDGLIGAGIGGVLVFLFAAWYYRVSGLVADAALLLNAVFVLALLALAGATLTLPGICGIALTIGMAVDCNIIIFERIREELRAGKGIRVAIESGFDRASVAVIDSNLTTLIAGVVLYSYGTGPIRGFAVTLMIGILTTLYAGVFVSRVLMEVVNSGRRDSISI